MTTKARRAYPSLKEWKAVTIDAREREHWAWRVSNSEEFSGAIAAPFDSSTPGINWISSGDTFVLAINRGDYVEVYDMTIVRRVRMYPDGSTGS